MDILFAAENIRKVLNDERAMVRAYGPEQAWVMAQCLATMRAADSLATLMRLPGRCHALTRSRADEFAIDLRGPYRMIIESAEEPEPRGDDGGLLLDRVTTVRILAAMEDYHG